MPRFEFDPAKSAANKIKDGIDFVEAQAIWGDADRLEIPARSTSEPRLPSYWPDRTDTVVCNGDVPP